MEHVEDDETDTVSKEMSEQGSSKQAREEQSQGSSAPTQENQELETLQEQLDIEVRLSLASVELKLDL